MASYIQTVRILWKRAAWWRFSLLSGLLLALLFMLFPPPILQYAAISPPVEIKPANYVTSVPPPAPSTVENKQPAATPQTADLSMATPANSENDAIKNEIGLDAATLGTLYSDSLKMNGFNVPLPGKNWAMLAHMVEEGPKLKGMAYFLGRIEHKRLIEAVIVHAHRHKSGQELLSKLSDKVAQFQGLYKSPECIPDTDKCWIMYGLFTNNWKQWANRSTPLSNLPRAAAGTMAADGITFPQDLIAVEFMLTDKQAYLEITYLYNPEADHIKTPQAATSVDTDWEPNNISHYPEKLAYIEKLKKWGTSLWPEIKNIYTAGNQ